MNSQRSDIDKAISRLEDLKFRTSKSNCYSLTAIVDSYWAQREIACEASRIVSDLMIDMCEGALELADSSGRETESAKEAISESINNAMAYAFTDSDDWAESILGG